MKNKLSDQYLNSNLTPGRYSDKQTELSQESDIWVEIINKAMTDVHETTVTEAFRKCFSEQSTDDRPFDSQTITRQDQRRISNCLQAAGWERAKIQLRK